MILLSHVQFQFFDSGKTQKDEEISWVEVDKIANDEAAFLLDNKNCWMDHFSTLNRIT